MSAPNPPIFDGHNDTLLRLYRAGGGGEAAFFTHGTEGHLDLPRARAGGFGGGFFAVFVPGEKAAAPDANLTITATGYTVRLADPVDPAYAQRSAIGIAAGLFRLEAASAGQVKVVRTADELAHCLQEGILAAILHFEGAEPIDPDLDALEIFYQAGLRSLGIVWSRPNAFGHGVPFGFPHSPDTGPGLTDAGRALVRACNRRGILIDLAHLNEQGFWDVANLSDAPLVATHTAVHALTASTRNLTDKQLDAIRDSDGMVGLNFSVHDIRADAAKNPDTPLTEWVRHMDYLIARIGPDRVGLGSDFDGTTIPAAVGDAAGLPHLLAAFRTAGYDDALLRKITHENWLRVLRQTWHPPIPAALPPADVPAPISV